jgi:ABC-type transport system involved in resistance to organic solvents, ATPase component
MNSAEPVIKVEGLTVRYGSNTVLENVGFEVQPGEIFVIMGGSGCGKSTLLKHVIGIETPAEGNIRINGADTSTLGDSELRKLHMGIGMLFQSSALFGSMTIGETWPFRSRNSPACHRRT